MTWVESVKSYVTQMDMLERATGKMPELIYRYAAAAPVLYGNGIQNPAALTAYRIFG